jgi:hypothetical protein
MLKAALLNWAFAKKQSAGSFAVKCFESFPGFGAC